MDGSYLRRNWGGEYENVAILVAIAVNEDGYREVLGAAEGMKEDKASWVNFFQWLRSGWGQAGGWGQVPWDAGSCGRSVPGGQVPALCRPLLPQCVLFCPSFQGKAGCCDAQGDPYSREQESFLREGKSRGGETAFHETEGGRQEDSIEETLTYCGFPSEHWTRICTNNVIERLNREIRRRTRVVGCFPDGSSALMLVYARLRHVAGTQ